MNNAVDGSASEHNAEKQDRNTITMCGAPLAPVGELSATVPWRSVESVIGVYAECVQRVACKHTLSEAAMLNIHLYAYLLSHDETILKLQEAF